jgi:predicted MPP superfamily phosphohydrolase
MKMVVLALAWAGALAWPALLAGLLWMGLKRGRGPGALGWCAVILASGMWFLGVWAVLWEPQTLVVRRIEVTSQAWSGSPLRIGVISDTHGGGAHMDAARMRRVVARMNAERPDIVMLLGDYVSGSTPAAQRSAGARRAVARSIAAFAGLEAPLGVHGVLGNHDWWYDGPLVQAELETAGVNAMENQVVWVERPRAQGETERDGDDSDGFWVAGLADYESQRAQPSYTATLAEIAPGPPVIVMSHWPDVFFSAPARVALTLSGHSHCGQVNFPFLGRLRHASEGSERWPCGLYEELGRKLYVSGGVGVSFLPVRFNQPPEIALLTLRGE